MTITKVVDTEVSTPTTVGTASSIGSASLVRLYNNQASAVIVSISTSVGAATTVSFTMHQSTVEFLQKLPTDVIYTSAAIKATKVAFTN